MAKLTLTDVASGYASTTAVNANNALIEKEFENTLSRDGSSPNHMLANLDLNGYLLLNSGNAIQVSGFTWEGPWITAQSYQVGDIVENNGSAYMCIIAHTSGVFATDLAARKWQLFATASLPDQVSKANRFLQTNGSTVSWEVPDATEIANTPSGTIAATTVQTAINEIVSDNAGNSGSSLIGFLQSGTGAVASTVQTKLRNFVNAKDFGAVGDGVTNDTTALQNAINYAVSVGKSLFIPTGNYSCTAQLTASTTTTQFVLVGEGPANTQLIWTSGAATRGLSVTYSDTIRTPRIESIGLITEALASGTALIITGPDSISEIQIGPKVSDVRIQGGNMASHCWGTGIEFITCWYPSIDYVNINGRNEYGPTFSATAGIKLTSCQVCYFERFNIFHVTTAILEQVSGVNTHGEGFTFINFEIVGVGTGIKLAADATAPGTNIGPGHINAFNRCIDLDKQFQTTIHDLLLYKTDDLTGTPQDFIAINMNDCRGCHVHNNFIHGFKANTLVGIQLSGTTTNDLNLVHNNLFYNFTASAGSKIGLVVGANTSESYFHSNYCDSTVAIPILISGAGLTNKFHNNFPLNYQTFTSADTTPSVANTNSGAFYTANAVATTITDFDDGYSQQVITVIANDANTTIRHDGVNIYLNGAVNFVMAAGKTLTLRLFDTLWREVGRS